MKIKAEITKTNKANSNGIIFSESSLKSAMGKVNGTLLYLTDQGRFPNLNAACGVIESSKYEDGVLTGIISVLNTPAGETLKTLLGSKQNQYVAMSATSNLDCTHHEFKETVGEMKIDHFFITENHA